MASFQQDQSNDIPRQRDDLLRPEILAAFDRPTFERDGYWVWENILTDSGRRRWTASVQKLQKMNDGILMDTDWGAIDFASRGLESPLSERITQEFKATFCGGSEQLPGPPWDGFMQPGLRDYMKDNGLLGPEPSLVTRGFKSQGIFPEYFPCAYDDFILDATTAHPQMMELFKKVLGEKFYLDHVIMLNRAPGSSGRRWHAHPYRQGQHEVEDIIGTGSAVTTEFLPQQCVRTLCYPEGASIEEGGEFAVIPGAHLYRIPFKWSITRTDYDEEMETTWLKEKTHPVTGEPLQILRLSLPPGSMVSFVHHMPHHVGHRNPNAGTRWGLLMAFRTPDPTATPAKWTEGVPLHWVERVEAAGKLSPTARQLFEADNPI